MKYPHLAARLFNTPLLIQRAKLEAILAAVGPRMGVTFADDGEDYGEPGPDQPGRMRCDYEVTEDGIAIIDVCGPLVKRSSGEFLSGGPTTYNDLEEEYSAAVADPAVRGILLLIDSPGGESTGAFELADAIYAQRGKKPCVAMADGDAFSAAYAIASAADQVVVLPSGGVGSVGVWMLHADYSGALEEAKIKVTFIQYGDHKTDGNPYQPLSEGAASAFTDEVNRIGEMFVATVARNRGMTPAAVRATQAGLFFGPNGVSVGFADQVGTRADAMALLRSKMQGGMGMAGAAGAANSKRSKRMEGQELEQALAAARTEGFGLAVQIIGLAALGGFSAKAAQKFLRQDAKIEDLRQEMTEARAEAGGDEIQSHILPGQGGTQTAARTEDSPVVKAAQKLAEQAARK